MEELHKAKVNNNSVQIFKQYLKQMGRPTSYVEITSPMQTFLFGPQISVKMLKPPDIFRAIKFRPHKCAT